MTKYANLALLILFPIAWFAPLLRAGLLPIFGLSEISIASGVLNLLETDVFLALIVLFFAIIAPLAKTVGMAGLQFGVIPNDYLPHIKFAGKLAMADIFLIALYIVLIKGGIGVGRVEVAWGLYLFTFCVLASIAISFIEERSKREDA